MSTTSDHLRKVIYLSGTRADFGLMQSTLQQLHHLFDLRVAVTGMHLDVAFGHTVDEIRAAGLRVCGEIPVDVTTRSQLSMVVALSACLQGVAQLLERERPDILLLLGDRGEMLAGALAALHLGIASVHVHGGERSGTVDEPVRHAISKLSNFHCVATSGSRERLQRMGENPDHIVVTGAPGLDGLVALGHTALPTHLYYLTTQPFVLAVFHPVVQQAQMAQMQTMALCAALQRLGLPVLWLEPNSDAGSQAVLQALDESALPPGSHRARHLPRPVFCAAMRQCAVMVGNSSSGIIEAASFGTPVVNIGQRQNLRERNANVTDVPAQVDAIFHALHSSLEHGSWPTENLYGDGHAGERIAQFLAAICLDQDGLEKSNTY